MPKAQIGALNAEPDQPCGTGLADPSQLQDALQEWRELIAYIQELDAKISEHAWDEILDAMQSLTEHLPTAAYVIMKCVSCAIGCTTSPFFGMVPTLTLSGKPVGGG